MTVRYDGRSNRKSRQYLLAAVAVAHLAHAGPAQLPQAETAYADFNDAQGAIALIDSGLQSTVAHRDRAQWQKVYADQREALTSALSKIATRGLSPSDRRALQLMQQGVAAGADPVSPQFRCEDARHKDAGLHALQQSLYACFAERGDRIDFENITLTRVSAFDLLTHMDEASRRRQLFQAFVPLWQAINGNDEPDSAYRRMIVLAGAQGSASAVDAAARTVGIEVAQVERWLVNILETWRAVTDDAAIEPWDYRYRYGAAERELAEAVSRQQMQPLNQRFYRDLGADLQQWGVLYDLDPRAGKAPLAYTDYVRRGRLIAGIWQPTLVRVSASYAQGGLGLLNELVHENGHAVHMMALHTRPAFMDLGDAVFYEAFADVPSWSVYEPAWQQNYLGRSAKLSASLQALYSNVMLDVAWGLFDLRMLRDPQADPNQVWTQITHSYLHVVPHPELSWWAARVQLVETPGYMVNYGLGSVITADIRARVASQIGDFDAGNARWYPWLAQQLLGSGQTYETAQLLRDFLGRPVSPQALLRQLRRMQVGQASS